MAARSASSSRASASCQHASGPVILFEEIARTVSVCAGPANASTGRTQSVVALPRGCVVFLEGCSDCVLQQRKDPVGLLPSLLRPSTNLILDAVSPTATACSTTRLCSGRGRPLPKLRYKGIGPFELHLQLNVPRLGCLAGDSFSLQLAVQCNAFLLLLCGQLGSSNRLRRRRR